MLVEGCWGRFVAINESTALPTDGSAEIKDLSRRSFSARLRILLSLIPSTPTILLQGQQTALWVWDIESASRVKLSGQRVIRVAVQRAQLK
jgi:hypothetical protein